jgi:hypothetical protein
VHRRQPGQAGGQVEEPAGGPAGQRQRRRHLITDMIRQPRPPRRRRLRPPAGGQLGHRGGLPRRRPRPQPPPPAQHPDQLRLPQPPIPPGGPGVPGRPGRRGRPGGRGGRGRAGGRGGRGGRGRGGQRVGQPRPRHQGVQHPAGGEPRPARAVVPLAPVHEPGRHALPRPGERPGQEIGPHAGGQPRQPSFGVIAAGAGVRVTGVRLPPPVHQVIPRPPAVITRQPVSSPGGSGIRAGVQAEVQLTPAGHPELCAHPGPPPSLPERRICLNSGSACTLPDFRSYYRTPPTILRGIRAGRRGAISNRRGRTPGRPGADVGPSGRHHGPPGRDDGTPLSTAHCNVAGLSG